MSEAILLVLWVGTSLFFICREIKAKSDRESHEMWISEIKECLRSIEREFSRSCQDIANNTHQQYSSFLTQISELEKQYKNEVYKNITSKKGEYFAAHIPDYIIKNYERNISFIADIYRNIYHN